MQKYINFLSYTRAYEIYCRYAIACYPVSQRAYTVLRCTLHSRCEEIHRTSHTPHCGLRPYAGLQRDCLFETYTHMIVRYFSLQDTCYSPDLGEVPIQQFDTLYCKVPALALASERPPLSNPIRSDSGVWGTRGNIGIHLAARGSPALKHVTKSPRNGENNNQPPVISCQSIKGPRCFCCTYILLHRF
jgi:hypothetical protein